MKYEFPKGFLWGASTSAHQVEGNDIGASRNPYEKEGVILEMTGEAQEVNVTNDWSVWEKENAVRLAGQSKSKYGHLPNWKDIGAEATSPQNYISGLASGHYNRYREDFALAKNLGHNATRLSIEWARVEPREGVLDKTAIAHYRDVIRAARENGFEPFITLWHWTLPLWLRDQGGVCSGKFPEYFTRYAGEMAKEFPEVKFWITLNEPEVCASKSYLEGHWPPQKRNPLSFLSAMNKLTKGHIAAYGAIKKINPNSQIGIAKNNVWFEATGPWSKILKIAADWYWNSLFFNNIKKHQDFIGLNHYFHNRISGWFGKNKNEKISDMGWELYPEAIYHCLIDLKKYNKPIYITENGIADKKDFQREKFIKENLKQISGAISEGSDVLGYFYWSLLDNFEWDKGFWPRFGLIEIDYKTLERKPRPSAYAYKKIIEENRVVE